MHTQKPKLGHKFFRFREQSKIILAEIPDNWGITRLGDITFPITKGTTPTTEGQKFVRSGIPFFKVESINEDGTINEKKLEYISNETHEKLKRSQIHNQDILFSIAGTLGRTYLVESRYVPSNTNQAIAIIRTKSNSYSKEFLEYILTSNLVEKQILIEKTTLAQSNLSLKQVSDIRIVNPPILEQQKIALILSDVDNLIQNTNQQIEQTQRLKKGMILKLLTKGIGHTKFKKVKWLYKKEIDIPEDFEFKPIKEFATIIMGQSPPGDSYSSDKKETPLLNGPTEFGDIYPTPIQYTSKPTRICNVDDILLCVRGSTTGRANLSDGEYCIGRGLAAIRGKIGKAITKWLYYNIIRLEPIIFNFGAGGGSTFANVNRETIEKFQISLPSIHEQKQIASILSNVDTQIQKEKLHKSNLTRLKRGLMQKLLTGKIRIKF